jgi:RNA polymerase sigma-70 factor (ECF subfamily)
MTNSAIDRLPPPFEEVIRRHEREILRFILRTTRDREDALDLFQDTWLRAYRAYARLDGPDGIRPWLYRIATNLCLNRVRDRARRSSIIFDGELAEKHEHGASHGAHDGLIDLKSAIGRLPRKQRAAMMMRKFGGLDYPEIAAALGCSLEAARAGVYQAMKKIRDMEQV